MKTKAAKTEPEKTTKAKGNQKKIKEKEASTTDYTIAGKFSFSARRINSQEERKGRK